MRRRPIYSQLKRPTGVTQRPRVSAAALGLRASFSTPASQAAATAPASRMGRLRTRCEETFKRVSKNPFALGFAGAALALALFSLAALQAWIPGIDWSKNPQFSQDDFNKALAKAIEAEPLPSATAAAANKVRTAVVRVRALAELDERSEEQKSSDAREFRSPQQRGISPPRSEPRASVAGDKPPSDAELGVGTGVLISEQGLILTNFHVVAAAKRLRITFFDGFESDAELISLQPDNDLAVIKAKRLPDDIEPATLGGTANLAPGDAVIAVGFPYGIGPSTTAGVVSGLNREFRNPEGERLLKGLIQFDAAANPGNSGGPLVNMKGEVVGIVTAIYNPTPARTFIGIGFAVTIEAAGGAAGLPPL